MLLRWVHVWAEDALHADINLIVEYSLLGIGLVGPTWTLSKAWQLFRVVVLLDLRVGRQQLLEGLILLTLPHDVRRVEQTRVGDVLEDIRVVNHLLEGADTEDLLNLSVQLVVVDEARKRHDLVHQAFHDLLVLFLVEIHGLWLLFLLWQGYSSTVFGSSRVLSLHLLLRLLAVLFLQCLLDDLEDLLLALFSSSTGATRGRSRPNT